MEPEKRFESYPAKYVFLGNAFNLACYAMGAYIMLGFGQLVCVLYLLYCFLMELSVLREGCVNCHYYGKTCFCGKGWLCAKFMKKGTRPEVFSKKVTWMMFVPSFIVAFMPIVGGVVQLLTRFDWALLIVLAVLVPFYFIGNAAIHGAFACKYCKQRQLGCGACEMFEKRGKK